MKRFLFLSLTVTIFACALLPLAIGSGLMFYARRRTRDQPTLVLSHVSDNTGEMVWVTRMCLDYITGVGSSQAGCLKRSNPNRLPVT